jgi:hypothetical protein
MARTVLIALLSHTWLNAASAQFTPALLQNETYWAGGKAEYDFYDAQLMRDGQARPCEVLHIFVREPSDLIPRGKPDEAHPRETIKVIKFNQIIHAPAGLVLYQQMHSSFFRIDNGMLIDASLTSSDSVGNTFKEITRVDEQISFDYRTYENSATTGGQNITALANGYFYDELPLRVRTIDFAKPKGEFEIQLAPSVINSKKDTVVFKPAKVSFTVSERNIDISVEHAAGTDRFLLDARFPFLLRKWQAADGSQLQMKNSLRVDYLTYNKNGDRERALKDPMLRHPD